MYNLKIIDRAIIRMLLRASSNRIVYRSRVVTNDRVLPPRPIIRRGLTLPIHRERNEINYPSFQLQRI